MVKEKYLLSQILLKQLLVMDKITETEFEGAFKALEEKMEMATGAALHIFMKSINRQKKGEYSSGYRICKINKWFSEKLQKAKRTYITIL